MHQSVAEGAALAPQLRRRLMAVPPPSPPQSVVLRWAPSAQNPAHLHRLPRRHSVDTPVDNHKKNSRAVSGVSWADSLSGVQEVNMEDGGDRLGSFSALFNVSSHTPPHPLKPHPLPPVGIYRLLETDRKSFFLPRNRWSENVMDRSAPPPPPPLPP